MERRWSLLALAVCTSLRFVLPQCEEFVSSPPSNVVIREGGGADLFCQQGDFVVNWYKESSIITDALRQEECDCSSEKASLGVANLTFMNFRPESAGSYGCWANRGVDFLTCNFEVAVAEPPVIVLAQDDVSGNQLGASLTISPSITFGLPRADITWSHVLNGQLNEISSEGVLTVTDVEGGDRGVYTIRASNIGGTVEATVNVNINFVEVERPTFELVNDKLVVTCVARGYPAEVTASVEPSGSDISSTGVPTSSFEITRTVKNTYTECDPSVTYTCMARSGTNVDALGSDEPPASVCNTRPPLAAPTEVTVTLLPGSLTEALVTWTPPAGSDISGYRIRFVSDQEDDVTINEATDRGTIQGLMAGTTYSVSVAAFRSPDEMGILFSSPAETLIVPECGFDLLVMKVDLSALLGRVDGQRTITVNWTASTDEGVQGYRVQVQAQTPPPSSSSVPVENFTTVTSFTLPVEYCNGSMYQITVSARDACGRIGPPQSVNQTCSSSGNVLTFHIEESRATELQLAIVQPNPDHMLSIIATTLLPLENGSLLTYTYSFAQASASLCIGGLTRATYYNVCVGTDDVFPICLQKATDPGIGGGTAPTVGCARPIDIVSNMQEVAAGGFPDWAIAVIVVGVFALVALIFCFIGLCFACNTSSSKDYDMGSVSSLQTPSIPPGSGGPPYITNHRNPPSPHRSCLSYHKDGHSTNWNEHRDTLRQMETDGGTHV